MTEAAHRLAVHGRDAEAERLSALLTSAAAGQGGALVLHGNAGIGKTALLDHVLARHGGMRCLRATGAEFEMELAYAALHQLCAPVLDHRTSLPAPQRAALESVFGLRDEGAPDPLLAGLAVLGLLAEAGQREPLACVVDDAQWLDAASLQALAFAARRIEAERVALVFAVRALDAARPLAGLARLHVGELADADARALLAAEVGAPLDEDVLERLVAEAQGNPLALLELPRSAGRHALAGGFGGLAARPVAGVIEERFAERMAGLASGERMLLVLAAAEPLGDPGLLFRAAGVLGLPAATAERVEASGLLALGTRVRFLHPVARSAAYRGATPAERRRAHAALADATDARLDPDRRAWHRAQAAVEPDEEVAAELVRSADRARLRGGLAAAAAFQARAAELTPDPVSRAGRMLAAAGTSLDAGSPRIALEQLERAQAGPLRAEDHGPARLLRALVAFQTRRDADATAALFEAAGALEPDASRETYLLALSSSMFLDRLPGRLQALARDVEARAPARHPPRPADELVDALTAQATRPVQAAVPAMRRAVAAFRRDSSGDPRWLDLACLMAVDLHDDEALLELADRQVRLARRQGRLAVLPQALNMRVVARVLAGRFTEAAGDVAEAHAVEEATGSVGLAFGEVILAAWRGDEARLDARFEALYARAGRLEMVAEHYARTVLYNGLGRYDAALEAASRASEQARLGSYAVWQLAPELIEAAVHAGRPDVAADALDQVVERSRASGTNWALGAELQCRALLADDADADALHNEAVERLARSQARAFAARARLLYGEWLRRRQRRVEARTQLRDAYAALSAMGAASFAARAARELEATGEHPRPRSVDLLDALTAQELHIARHVASGATSKEVAAELFLSPRTIDAHLRSIFRKLGVTSRRQLRDLKL